MGATGWRAQQCELVWNWKTRAVHIPVAPERNPIIVFQRTAKEGEDLMRSIRGKKALITGAASGIGRAIAIAMAKEGADLWLLDIDEAGLESVVSEASALGVTARGARCDVTDQSAVTQSIQALIDEWSHVDILINNAGVAYYGPTDKMTAEQWKWLLDINLMAPIQFTRELLPILLARPEGHVLNMCSLAGLAAGGRFAAYHVSKFGLVGFSEALRAEYGRRGLGVTALCPGPVRTNLYSSAISGKKNKPVPTPPAWLCTTEEKVALAAVRALRRNRRMVLLTPLAHVVWNTKKFAPWLLDWMSHLGRKKPKPACETLPGRETNDRPAGQGQSRAA
jgi:short-subunit dehydrogenase